MVDLKTTLKALKIHSNSQIILKVLKSEKASFLPYTAILLFKLPSIQLVHMFCTFQKWVWITIGILIVFCTCGNNSCQHEDNSSALQRMVSAIVSQDSALEHYRRQVLLILTPAFASHITQQIFDPTEDSKRNMFIVCQLNTSHRRQLVYELEF